MLHHLTILKTYSIRIIISILAICYSLVTQAQTDSLESDGLANSCQPYFDKNKIAVHYFYNVSNQTHDYSRNWDFDGDGKTDGLYFIGTGGAHLYFYLRIILSSDKRIRDFTFLKLDMPCVGRINDLESARFYPPPFFPFFVVDYFFRVDNGVATNDKIYLHLDNQSHIPSEWQKRGVTSRYLLLMYDNGDMKIRNFIE